MYFELTYFIWQPNFKLSLTLFIDGDTKKYSISYSPISYYWCIKYKQFSKKFMAITYLIFPRMKWLKSLPSLLEQQSRIWAKWNDLFRFALNRTIRFQKYYVLLWFANYSKFFIFLIALTFRIDSMKENELLNIGGFILD